MDGDDLHGVYEVKGKDIDMRPTDFIKLPLNYPPAT